MKPTKSVALALALLAAPEAAVAQGFVPFEFNPTVLAPSARNRLPQGGMIIAPPQRPGRWGAAPGRQMYPPVVIYRYKPFMDDNY